MYESRHEKLAHPRVFLRRLALHALAGLAMIAVSLGIGMAGYRALEDLSWMDAFLNSAMLIGGMGPVDMPRTEAGKLFAGIYAIYAGLAFVAAATLLFAPIGHRVLHRFHWRDKA